MSDMVEVPTWNSLANALPLSPLSNLFKIVFLSVNDNVLWFLFAGILITFTHVLTLGKFGNN
jgi:uncharacterized membrane protein YccF (DUF307 family)